VIIKWIKKKIGKFLIECIDLEIKETPREQTEEVKKESKAERKNDELKTIIKEYIEWGEEYDGEERQDN